MHMIYIVVASEGAETWCCGAFATEMTARVYLAMQQKRHPRLLLDVYSCPDVGEVDIELPTVSTPLRGRETP